MKNYDVVRVVAIRNNRFSNKTNYYARTPVVGDIGCIVETYNKPEPAFEVECSDPKNGTTIWLEAMFPEELELK